MAQRNADENQSAANGVICGRSALMEIRRWAFMTAWKPPQLQKSIGHALRHKHNVGHRSPVMRFTPFILILALLVGCAHDDARLHGTWRSNRDATVSAAFQRDTRWRNAPPERVERFREMFGHMTITYSNGMQTADYRGTVESFRYRVVKRGPDFVVIRSDATLDKGRDIRIRFVDGDSGYWIDTGPLGFGLEERFDRVQK